MIISIKLVIQGRKISATAFIDSEAEGNYIDEAFTYRMHVPLLPCQPLVAVAALDSRQLGTGRVSSTTYDLTLRISSLHTEIIRLFTISFPDHAVILSLPWLELHNPDISWADYR